MSATRPIWFVLANDRSGGVAPVSWEGQLTIALFVACLLVGVFAPMLVGQAIGQPGWSALALVIPALVFVPFLFVIRARLDSTKTKDEYFREKALDIGGSK